MKELTTDRCVLRKLSRDDAPHVWSAAHTPGFTDGMTWDPPENEDEMHAFTDAKLQEWDAGDRYVWSIFSLADGEFIGRIELNAARELPGAVWGLGYWIHPSQQKKGYATEASREAIRFAFDELGADAIVSSHADWNHASGNVLAKAGMKHTGFTEGRVFKHGKPVRSAEFWLDRKDWVST